MGVHGLWKLIEPSGKPVPLETLEGKVLAVDISIWLHQFIKGFQDGAGAPIPNAHLLGIYHRLCKLLYFKIKPVFVFDGGVPALKRQTIALRNQKKSKNLSEADRIHKNLLSALVKHTAISKVLGEKAKAAITAAQAPPKRAEDDDLYVLPPAQLDSTVSSSEDEENPSSSYDLHSIDTQSVEFKSLPVDVRHEILTDLKDTRKQSSWGRINELPTQSDDFSTYQMGRLLKRQSVQSALEEAEQEMGGHSLSLGELEQILKDQGVINTMKGNRIASDENTRFLLIKDLKQALEEAKQKLETGGEEEKRKLETVEEEEEKEISETGEEGAKNRGEREFEDDLEKAIALSLEEVPSTSKEVKKIGGKGKNRMPLSFLADFSEADFGSSESSDEELVHMKLTPARRYMMEYSNLTPSEIARILAGAAKKKEEGPTKKQGEEGSTKKQEREGSTKKQEEEVETQEIEDEVSTSNLEPVDQQVPESSVNAEDEPEVMSEGSSSCDDFLDVEEPKQMEVVIKPGEELEDDLFKDIFEDEPEGKAEEHSSKTEEKSVEEPVSSSIEAHSSKTDSRRTSLEEKSVSSTVETDSKQAEIEKLIKNYSKPQQAQEAKLSVEQLTEMKANLSKEQAQLAAERGTKERLAGNLTDQMYQEAQELLELFGVPYITAPMEAEAQCAFLELIDLTDGTITDDSDIWLFGGRTVYKNFFNQSKMVLEFKSESIHHHYKLTREQMILLALLVGSDYTIGLTGVGPVTALEILASFPPKNHLVSGLAEFKAWVSRGMVPGPGRSSLRGKVKNVRFTEAFPNRQIVDAYLDPQVETSKEKFSWGKLDVVGLEDYAKLKFGWSKTKTDEILKPVLRRLEENRAQKAITDYFKYEVRVSTQETEKAMSARVKTALERIGKGEVEEEAPEAKRKRAEGKSRRKTGKEEASSSKEEDAEIKILKETKARSGKRVQEIEREVQQEAAARAHKVSFQRLHKKDVITQKQRDKTDNLRNKLKAIETFRKSKQGPGYVKKRGKSKPEPKQDAGYLSESSASD